MMRSEIKKLAIIFLVYLMKPLVFAQEPRIIKSPNRPILGPLTLKLKKDLILGEESPGPYLFASINGIEVSDKHIYVLDAKMAKVNVYDLGGKFLREVGRKGEGPGEFMIPASFCLRPGGDVCVYDMQRRRILVFDSEGIFKWDFAVEKLIQGKFYVDEQDYVFDTRLKTGMK